MTQGFIAVERQQLTDAARGGAMPARRFASFRVDSKRQRPRDPSSQQHLQGPQRPAMLAADLGRAAAEGFEREVLRPIRKFTGVDRAGQGRTAQIDWKRALSHRSSHRGRVGSARWRGGSARARRLPRSSAPMPGDPNAHLAQVLAAPDLVAGLEDVDVPQLLGALEKLRASLWARMLRAPTSSLAPAPDAADQVLTVADVASELQFTRAYVYEAVRRGDLPAIRKGRYVRVRRADLRAWLDGHGPGRLDERPARRDSSRHALLPSRPTSHSTPTGPVPRRRRSSGDGRPAAVP